MAGPRGIGKIPPVSCATVLAKVLAEKDRDMVRKKACCGCEIVGSHVGLDGDDTACLPVLSMCFA